MIVHLSDTPELLAPDDPNRVRVIGEMSVSEVEGVKDYFASERMQKVFKQVNEISASPIEFVWFDDVTP